MKHKSFIVDKTRFNIGDIVYFVDEFTHKLDWGVLTEYYSDGYALELYEVVDCRLIDGVPIKEFPFNHARKKLPKGWTYKTQLYKITYSGELAEIVKENLTITDKDNLKHLIEVGAFVKPNTQLHGHIESDVTKDGYTIKLSSYYGDHDRPSYVIVPDRECYSTYEEANATIDSYYAELKRQAELTDYEWSVEQIDKTLSKLTWCSNEYKSRAREFLLKQYDVEDIVTRGNTGGIEWKYDKNKKWMLVVV